MRSLLTTALLLLFTVIAVADIKIDADYPGGNIIVAEIDGDTVRLERDLRNDTPDFYWSFRIKGAEGRTLNFELTKGANLSTRGPAVSSNNGVTWRWLSDETGFPATKFQYVFGADEKEVLFSAVMNYTARDLNRFLEKYKDNVNLKIETLCQSKKGRKVELLRIPGKGNDADFKAFFTVRHHAREMSASYTLEGILETVLSDSDDGKWLREHCDFFIVPFVDKDGVEDGDSGKNRKPHDHNRDYIQKIYPEVRAITEQVPLWQNGKPLFSLDLHGPGLRAQPSGNQPENNTTESIYFTGPPLDDPVMKENWEKVQRFCKILEKEKKGPIPYKESFNLPFGAGWNTAGNVKPGMLQSKIWAIKTFPDHAFVSTIEIPYANASGVVVDADALRFLGRDLVRTMRIYLETQKK